MKKLILVVLFAFVFTSCSTQFKQIKVTPSLNPKEDFIGCAWYSAKSRILYILSAEECMELAIELGDK